MCIDKIERIKVIECQPFLNTVKDIVEQRVKKYINQVKILEIGCGAGDLSLILKDELKDKVNITAIDPSSDKIEQAKSKSSAVRFEKNDIYHFTSYHKYDIVMFTKSLHHCNPVEKAIQLASNLLVNKGVFIAEEISSAKADHTSMSWFFDRLDLLSASNMCFQSADTSKKTLKRMLNTSLLPVEKRWIRQKDDDPNRGIVSPDDICNSVNAQFGKENVQIYNAPFFHVLIVYAGLKNNEAGESVLQKIMEQEERDIRNRVITPYGMYIIATKL